MEKFTKIISNAAYLPIINIDTDMIIPKQFLTTITRSGLGKNLFYEMRYESDGSLNNDFILNSTEYKNTKIIIAGANFGCGSSREHAPWSLLDFGIRVIIAPSFADIFYNNCFKNSILPIILEQNIINELGEISKDTNNIFTIDLVNQKIIYNSKSLDFDIPKYRKECLLEGYDDVSITLQKDNLISNYEKKINKLYPWLN